jgi:hypothetical protein
VFWIVRCPGREHTDSAHSLPLLRARRERPSRRAAEQQDELAAFHCPMPPVLRTARIAHLRTEKTAALRDFNSPHVGLGSKRCPKKSSASPLYLNEPTSIAATFAAGQCHNR